MQKLGEVVREKWSGIVRLLSVKLPLRGYRVIIIYKFFSLDELKFLGLSNLMIQFSLLFDRSLTIPYNFP